MSDSEPRLRRVCAWCDPPRVLDEGAPGAETTHTICEDCERKEREETEAKIDQKES